MRSAGRHTGIGLALAATLLLLFACHAPPSRTSAPPKQDDRPIATGKTVRTDGGIVVSVDELASEIGARMLARGGNAIDAAVATAFALAVTYPRAGNLGGGGFMMIRTADGRSEMIDYREVAPAAAGPDAYLRDDGTIVPKASILGYRAAGVPGTVPGLALAHARHGKLPWRELVEPAIRLAAQGFTIDEDFAESIAKAADEMRLFPASAEVFLDSEGAPPRVGDRFRQPDLAWSLREIAREGASAMTTGAVAKRLVESVRAEDGWLALEDLAVYQPRIRETLSGTYRGYEIVGPPLPSSGGITLIMMLNFLQAFDVARHGADSPETLHLMTEAMRRAYRDRAAYLGDRDFVDVPVDRLIAPEHVHPWIGAFDAERATPSEDLAGAIQIAPDGPETTHFSVVDADGNAVSNTYTLNYSWGSKAVARGTGILLNNEMDDFNLRPGYTDRRGKIGTAPNRIAPGKRMLSSMTPLFLLKDGELVLVAGSPGGRTIINTLLRIVVGLVDFGMPLRDAVAAPRLHHAWFPDKLTLEEERFPEATTQRLEALGHTLGTRESQGDAHCIAIDPATGMRTGVADTRIDGAASAPR